MIIKNQFSLLLFFLSIFPFSNVSCSESSSSTETGPIVVVVDNESPSAAEIEAKIALYRSGWNSAALRPTQLRNPVTAVAMKPKKTRTAEIQAERERNIRFWANRYKKNPHLIPQTEAHFKTLSSIQTAGLEQMLLDKQLRKEKTKTKERKQPENAPAIKLKLPQRTSSHHGTISRSSASLNLDQLVNSESSSSLTARKTGIISRNALVKPTPKG